MSGDGPPKVAPPLDDIVLGEDAPPPPARPPVSPVTRASARPPPLASAAIDGVAPTPPRPAAVAPLPLEPDAKDKDKKRQKLTLRIPDDEVSRSTTSSSNKTAAARPARPGSIPDDGLGVTRSADDTLEQRAMPGIDTSKEQGWTPYQPPVAEAGNGHRPPAVAKVLVEDATNGLPLSEEIPIDTDITGEHVAIEDEPETTPRLPLLLDSEEIKIEEGPVERAADAGDEEVDIADLVSVESVPTLTAQPGPRSAGAPSPRLSSAAKPAGSRPAASPLPVAPAPVAPLPSVTTPSSVASGPVASGPVASGPVASSPVASGPVASGPKPVAAPPAVAAAIAPTPTPPAVLAKQAHAQPSLGSPMEASKQTRPQQPGPQGGKPGSVVAPAGALAPPPMTEAAVANNANKRKVRPWWEELFNDDHIRTMAKISDPQIAAECTFIEDSLGCESGAMILDLACGTGRHAVELARRGYQVVGYDLSLSMLARASDEAQERGQKINFVQGDMREMTFEETFDGIYTWNTSFGFFDEEKNNAVIARVHRALKKGGQFLLDVVNRDYIIRQAPSLAWFEGDGCICMDEMQIDFITSRMKVKRTLMMDDGRTKEIEYSVRVYALHELGKLLHDNGFRVAEVSGRTGTPGVFFGCESPRTLILAEKR